MRTRISKPEPKVAIPTCSDCKKPMVRFEQGIWFCTECSEKGWNDFRKRIIKKGDE